MAIALNAICKFLSWIFLFTISILALVVEEKKIKNTQFGFTSMIPVFLIVKILWYSRRKSSYSTRNWLYDYIYCIYNLRKSKTCCPGE